MFKVLVVFFFIVFLALLCFLFWVFNYEPDCDREFSSSFECGFDSFNVARSPYSINFFFFLVLFLVFDVEICAVLGLPVYTMYSFYEIGFGFFCVLVVLLLGVVEEWRRGALVWSK